MNRTIQFTVDGPLLGGRSSRDRLYGKSGKDYAAFKRRVLALAMAAGWKGRAKALKSMPPKLSVYIHWLDNALLDWKNVYWAVEDALFSDDRHVIPGQYSGVSWSAIRATVFDEIHATVTVEV